MGCGVISPPEFESWLRVIDSKEEKSPLQITHPNEIKHLQRLASNSEGLGADAKELELGRKAENHDNKSFCTGWYLSLITATGISPLPPPESLVLFQKISYSSSFSQQAHFEFMPIGSH